ncbi:MAG: nitroreductase family protein [Lachnospiraceae bacterium]
MKKDFLEAIADRRSYYGISKETVAGDERIEEIVRHVVKHTPSAFNSQSTRVILLLNEQHDRLWDITMDALRKIMPPEQFGATESKINSFKSGYGTILFFDDTDVTKALQAQFALYKDNFPVWAQQSNGMNQFALWTALEIEGFGVSLQHYNELIEAAVKEEWSIPDAWQLIAQMPFGKPSEQPGEKEFQPLEGRIRVLK